MKLMELKCPSCAGLIQMDVDKDYGFCLYCGNRFVVQDEIQKIALAIELSGKVQIEGMATIENLLIRAKQFMDSRDEIKAIEYYNRVLDLDPHNVIANENIKLLNARTLSVNGVIIRPEDRDKFEKLLMEGNVINAIKLIREISGCELQKAKDFTDIYRSRLGLI